MRKQILVAVGVTLAVILALAGIKFFQISKAMSEQMGFSPPPEAVTSIVVAEEMWPRTLSAIGTLSSSQGVLLSAQEAATVTRIGFESGQRVKEGDVLVEQDTSVEEANLKSALAALDDARLTLSRAKTLRSQNAGSQADLDAAQAKERQATATVDSLRATIGRRKIVAPFAGQTGIRLVNLGQYLAPGAGVVPLHALDPLYADFSLPQQRIGEIAVGQKVLITVDAYPGEKFEGQITAVNPDVDHTTRNVGVQATLPNPEERLRPGMFANITVILPQQDKVIAIPMSGVQYAPYGDTVYVVETMKGQDNAEYLGVRQQVVKLGRKMGDRVVVLDGVLAGQQIVTSGSFKLRQGAKVLVNNQVQPGNEMEPRPDDT